jgi:ABC-2 type transport system permease protein
MTAALATTPPRALTPAGRRPGMMVAWQVSRGAGRSGALWGLIFALYVIAQTFGYTAAYKTSASRNRLAKAFGTNVGLRALIGPAHAINTIAGYVAWRELGILSLLGAIWGLLTSTRLLRGEEEAGRYELLLSGQTTRRRAGTQAVTGLGVGLIALFALTAIGTVLTGRASSVDFSLGASLYLSVTLIAGAAMFLAIGAVTSQLATTRRRAASIGGVVFGIAYALRMVADSDAGLHWMVWLSPLGWIEESRPLTNPHPMALLPALALVIVAIVVALHLADARDLGGATFSEPSSAAPHLALVGSSTGLAARLMRPVALGWLFAVGAFSVLIGTVAQAATEDIRGSKSVEQALGRIGGHGSVVNDYLGLTFLVLAAMIALVAAGQVVAIRAEEAEGRLENLVVRPLTRWRWFAQRLGLSTVLLVAAGLLAGVGAWVGAASQHSGVGLGSLLVAGVNIVLPALFLLGLGALAIGLWPRRASAIVYGYLAWSFLIEFIGAVVHANHIILDSSVFFHLAPAPAANPDWVSATVMLGLAGAGALVGCVFLSRRDELGA